MDLLERDASLEILAGLLREVAAGQGRLVLVGGEAGVGKTALVRRFCGSARAEMAVLVGACDALSTPRPLGPLLDIAPGLGAALESLLQEGAPRTNIFGALLSELAQGPRPRVLIFEDIHWADEATLDLVRFLARRLERTRTLLVATYRDDEVGPRHPLRVVLGDIATNPAVRRLSVQPLSAEAVGRLAAGSDIDPVELYRRTGGNPFFVTEVLASAQARVPITVADAVLARAARLSERARHALEAAAVLGFRFEPSLLEAVTGVDTEALDACLEAGVVMADGASIVFRHELMREVIYDALPAHRRADMHRAALITLVKAGIRDDLLAALAHHAEAAGDSAAVLEYAPAAGQRAAQLGAHREAAAQYARALRWTGDADDSQRALLLEARGLECYLTDQADAAIEARKGAAQLRSMLGERERQGDNLRWLSRAYWIAGRNNQAEAASRDALEVLEELPPGPPLAWAYSNHSQLRMLSADYAESIRFAERALEVAAACEAAPELTAHAMLNRGSARWHSGGDGRADVEESLRLSLQNGFEDHAARAFAILASTSVVQYALANAEIYIDRGIEYTREHDLHMYRRYLLSWRAVVLLHRGHWREAQELAESIEASREHTVFNRLNALTVIARVRARRGEPGCWEPLDRALELAEGTGELQRLAPVRSARAEAAWLQLDLERATTEARPALELGLQKHDAWFAAEPALWLWRSGAMGSPPAELPELFTIQIAGDWRSAAEQWRDRGCPYEHAAALADGNDVPSLREALAIADNLGARPLAAFIVGRLRELGARPSSGRTRPDAHAPLDGDAALGMLTPREREVAVLVAQGFSNREIAGTLVISERTTENHIQHILDRLGLRSRTQIATWAIQHGVSGGSGQSEAGPRGTPARAGGARTRRK